MDPQALNSIAQQFQQASAQWFDTLFSYAQWTFSTLAALEIAVSLILRMSAGAFLIDVLVSRMFRLCFFSIVLFNCNWWIPSLLDGFIYAGATAGGFTGDLNPASVFTTGCFLAGKLLDKMSTIGMLIHPATTATALIVAYVILFSYAAIAATLMFTLIESYIVVGCGTLFLGFGAYHGTSEITTKYMSYIFAVGAKLFMLTLIAGMGTALSDTWAQILAASDLTNFYALFNVMGAALAFALVSWKIPSLTGSLLMGSLGFSLESSARSMSYASHLAGATVSAPTAATKAAASAASSSLHSAYRAGAGYASAGRGPGNMGSSGATGGNAAAAGMSRLSQGSGNLKNAQNKKP